MNKGRHGRIEQRWHWFLSWMLLVITAHCAQAQHGAPADSMVTPLITVTAGKEYNTSSFHQWLWGKHYRKEWGTPVTVPIVSLDTLMGGLVPYAAGGGLQTNTLRLRNKMGKQYVLRSVNKSFDKGIPEIYQNTFIESIINDQVSIAHPYAAVAIAPMAEAAKIYHTWPRHIYIQQQPALGVHSKNFGDQLFLFEQRPDENWEEASNFGNAKNIIGTEKLLEALREDHDNKGDALLFLKARLFDMLIGDWGRHEDQWRWAEFKTNGSTFYQPVPRDRDQAFTKFDGLILKVGPAVAGLGHLESFGPKIKDVPEFNFPARYLDRRFLNEPSLQQWVNIAKQLQQQLTDSVIEKAMQQLPPEVYPISGEKLAFNLKSRRDRLSEVAADYYSFLAKEVDITGSEKKEYFEIKRLNKNETEINIYKLNEEGIRSATPFYTRTFTRSETKEIRLYGIAGNDQYSINGKAKDGIKIRIIAGVDRDSIINRSNADRSKTIIYDNPGNYIKSAQKAKVHLDKDTAINAYRYDEFQYDKRGISPIVFYSNADRLYAGLNYSIENYKWRQKSYASKHKFGVRYSLTQNAFNFLYKGEVNEFIGRWNLSLDGHYDFIKWTNFFGIGNETKEVGDDRDFYRMRSRDGFAAIGLNRDFGKHHNLAFKGFLQSVKVMDDSERFVAKNYLAGDKNIYERKNFGGLHVQYRFQVLDDVILPAKGIYFSAIGSYSQNLQQQNRTVTHYQGNLNFYIPLIKNFVLAVRTGGATLTGTPEFYQLNSIGGTSTLRGFRRDRFWGKTAFFNSTELQWHANIRSHWYNGKLALVALLDNGRVWQPGETSSTWHTGYGAGLLLAPFNKGMVSVTVARSRENIMVHLGYGITLN